MEVIMINTILDIIRLLNDGNIVPMQKDEDTKIDLSELKKCNCLWMHLEKKASITIFRNLR